MMYDYDASCINRGNQEIMFTLPIVATSYKKAKEIAEKYLELYKGVAAIDYIYHIVRTYPGRDIKVIREEDVTFPGIEEVGK